MKIAIDARPLHWPGIGRYIRELIAHLALVDKENEYFIWINARERDDTFASMPKRFQVVKLRSSVHSLGEQFEMYWRLVRDGVDLLHCPSSLAVPFCTPCTTVVTVHDMLFNSPSGAPLDFAARLYFKLSHHRAIHLAAQIITVSDFTLRELLKHEPKLSPFTQTVYNGVAPAFVSTTAKRPGQTARAILGVEGDYFIAVGSLKKHKNFSRLLRSYARLPEAVRQRYSLVLVTQSDLRSPDLDVLDVLHTLRLGRQVSVVSGLSDEDLAAAYSAATSFVSVALYEGFGLPIIEAMACGTAVIASDIEVFREVAGDAASYVNPENEESIAAALARAASDNPFVTSMQVKGLRRSQRFNWLQSARDTLATYYRALDVESPKLS